MFTKDTSNYKYQMFVALRNKKCQPTLVAADFIYNANF